MGTVEWIHILRATSRGHIDNGRDWARGALGASEVDSYLCTSVRSVHEGAGLEDLREVAMVSRAAVHSAPEYCTINRSRVIARLFFRE